MKAIIGLGNPGPDYQATRHNVGWWVVEQLAEHWRARAPRARHSSAVSAAEFCGKDVLLVKPLTFMNESGVAVRSLVGDRDLSSGDLLVVYDDLDLPLGQLRVRPRGGAGGHKGLGSVLLALGSQDVPRLRIGIGPQPTGVDRISFVLGEFGAEELKQMEHVADRAAQAVECVLCEGLAVAMDRYNAAPRTAAAVATEPSSRPRPLETAQ